MGGPEFVASLKEKCGGSDTSRTRGWCVKWASLVKDFALTCGASAGSR